MRLKVYDVFFLFFEKIAGREEDTAIEKAKFAFSNAVFSKIFLRRQNMTNWDLFVAKFDWTVSWLIQNPEVAFFLFRFWFGSWVFLQGITCWGSLVGGTGIAFPRVLRYFVTRKQVTQQSSEPLLIPVRKYLFTLAVGLLLWGAAAIIFPIKFW
ncbi:hypothetical protein M1271_00985 [Patescibacteria group bacterium]|nr:hypothetical protein [Patescibacteria group bacterium]MCL5798437.1 hypothetical protein [Patescibacteria group bacterium]